MSEVVGVIRLWRYSIPLTQLDADFMAFMIGLGGTMLYVLLILMIYYFIFGIGHGGYILTQG
jgi:hypothetical protein